MSKPQQPRKIWNIEKPDDWQKQVLALPPDVQKKLLSVVETMIHNADPRRQGEFKRTKYGPAYVADLDRSYRLAYRVFFQTYSISIIRVGDHKEVYGKGS